MTAVKMNRTARNLADLPLDPMPMPTRCLTLWANDRPAVVVTAATPATAELAQSGGG